MYRLVLLTLVLSCSHLLAQGGGSGIGGRPTAADAIGAGSPDRRSVSVRGTAELDNGESAPTDTLVELQCVGMGKLEQEVRTDGTFNFQFTAVNSSARTGPRTAGMTIGVTIDCQIQAMLNGHYSPRGTVFGSDTNGMFDAGKLILHRKDGDVQGMTVSSTSLEAPKAAQKEFQKGQQAAAKKKWKDAIKQYEKAVAAYPEYAEAWNALGGIQQIQKKNKDARASYEKSLAADSNYLPPAVRLALLDVQDGNWEQVAARTGDVLKLNPFEFPQAYLYNVLANLQLDKLAEAETMGRKALERNVQASYPQLLHTLGMVLAAQGKLEDAVKQYESFFALAPDHPDRKMAEQQLTIIKENL